MKCAETRVLVFRASEIEPERVRWIWQGVLARGKVTGLVGHPGLGKSQVAANIAATLSTGRPWPGGTANETAGDVIILSAEDGAADTLVPRLIAADADRARIHIVKAVEDGGDERRFNLALDLDRLAKEIDLDTVGLLVIDPASAYLGTNKGKGIDRNNARDVRTILDRLGSFAARHDLAVLAISHLNKSGGGTRAITRIMGSQEWAAAPRAIFLVTEEPGTGRRLFLPVKNNLARDRIGYAFEINDMIVGDGIATSAAVWGEPVTISADDALAGGETQKRAMWAAVEFLVQALREGPVDQAEIVQLGEQAGFTAKNLRTAREKLGIKPKKEGFGAAGKWVWLPPSHLRLVVDNEFDDRLAPANVDPSEIGNNGGTGPGAAGDTDGGGCAGPGGVGAGVAGAAVAGDNTARAGTAGDDAVDAGGAAADGGRGDQSNGIAGGEGGASRG